MEPSGPGPIARHVTDERLATPVTRAGRTSRTAVQDLLTKISTSLDPATQAARTEERATRTLQTTQLFSITSQLRDAQTTIETLRNRLLESDRTCQAAERRADKAELIALFKSRGHHSRSRSRNRGRSPSPTRHWKGRKYRQDVVFADGGGATYWIGSDDSDGGGRLLAPEDTPGTRRYTRYDSDIGSSQITIPRSQPVFHGMAGDHGSPRQRAHHKDNLNVIITPTRRGDQSLAVTITPGASNSRSMPGSGRSAQSIEV